MKLSKIHTTILSLILDKPRTVGELSKITKRPTHTIRARTSELRKAGYRISKTPYTINLTPKTFATTITKADLWDQPVSIKTLAYILSTKPPVIELFLSKNFSNYTITQLSPNTVKLGKPYK